MSQEDEENETGILSPLAEPKNDVKTHHNKCFFSLPKNGTECKKSECLLKINLPFGILTISLLQILSYATFDDYLQKNLRFEPKKLNEPWRFITYMLLHEDGVHLSLNILMQIIFAYGLELRHSRWRIILLYFMGGITAILGASCLHPDVVIGASGGVYTLLTSHIADIIMNLERIKYKVYRCFCIILIVMSDVVYNIVHFRTQKDPIISWETHVIGGMSGLFLGFVFFRKNKEEAKTRKLSLFWVGVFLYVCMFAILVALAAQIKKCTPMNVIRIQYVYVC